LSLTALTELLTEVAAHQSQPVAVDDCFVFCIDRGDGVLAVLNRGKCRLEANVFDACGIGTTDCVVAVDLNLGVETVVLNSTPVGSSASPV